MKYDIEIEEGATLSLVFSLELEDDDGTRTAFSLDGYNARFQARVKLTDETPVIDLGTETSGLSIAAEDGMISMSMTATQTAALDFYTAMYTLEIYTASDAVVYRVLDGIVTLSREYAR